MPSGAGGVHRAKSTQCRDTARIRRGAVPAPLMERMALEFLFVRVEPFGRMVFAQHGADIGLDRADLERSQ